MVKPGDVVQVRKPPVTYSFKVLQAIEKRVGAKLVPEIMENVTPREQYELLEMSRISGFVNRAKGTGRPTKKDRRDLDEFFTPEYTDDFDFEFDFDDDNDGPDERLTRRVLTFPTCPARSPQTAFSGRPALPPPTQCRLP